MVIGNKMCKQDDYVTALKGRSQSAGVSTRVTKGLKISYYFSRKFPWEVVFGNILNCFIKTYLTLRCFQVVPLMILCCEHHALCIE